MASTHGRVDSQKVKSNNPPLLTHPPAHIMCKEVLLLGGSLGARHTSKLGGPIRWSRFSRAVKFSLQLGDLPTKGRFWPSAQQGCANMRMETLPKAATLEGSEAIQELHPGSYLA